MRLGPGLVAFGSFIFGFACSASNSASGPSGGGGSANAAASGGSSAVGGGGGVISSGGSGGGINVGGFAGTAGVAGACAGLTEGATNSVLPADVIWAIDTSGSMTEETAAVRQNMNAFSQQITAAGVDVRIVLIAEQWVASPFPGIIPDEGICIDAPLGSGSCPNDTNLPKFAHIYQTVSSTNSLDLFLSTYPLWKTQLRDDAVKIFVVVTDDNSDLPAADFTDQLNAIDPMKISPNQWRFYGIYCFTQCPSAASVGSVYAELVAQTQGVAGDLCLQNFKPVFDQLATGIVGATKIDCAWEIPPPPAGMTFDKNKVNVVYTSGTAPPNTIGHVETAADCGPAGGWYYDNDTNPQNVLLCPATCQMIQADQNEKKIEIKFGCDTVIVPA